MPRESYFLIKWEMIFRTSAFLDFIPCGFAPLSVNLSFWPTQNGQGESLESVKSRGEPSENLHLSVSCAEITVQLHDCFQLLLQHREETWMKKTHRNEGRSYRQHGISLSFSMENVAQGRRGLAGTVHWGMRGQKKRPDRIIWGSFMASCLTGATLKGHGQLICRKTSGGTCWLFGCSAGCILIGFDWQWNHRIGPSSSGQHLQFVALCC